MSRARNLRACNLRAGVFDSAVREEKGNLTMF